MIEWIHRVYTCYNKCSNVKTQIAQTQDSIFSIKNCKQREKEICNIVKLNNLNKDDVNKKHNNKSKTQKRH